MSKLFSLNNKDFLKGLILAVGTPVLYYLQEFIPTITDLEPIYKIAISAFITYLIKNFFTTESVAKGEYTYTPQQDEAVADCVEILDNVGLELVGTRPKDR